ncbi:MAG TPA: nucleoside hydrolase [Chloroflexaceae bacterium]|nr:nucleoside hydrolase [Chloroflexaceae bacterium]
MSGHANGAPGRMPVFVDTDTGCDDAIALAWLLRRPEAEVVGLSSVFGNSSIQNTTANLLTVLEALDCDAPVTVGASGPLVYLRTGAGALAHGPDGLWGHQRAQALDLLPWGAPGAIAAAARAHPGLTILALGPLTNVARAAQAYPDDLAGVRLVALAGSRGAGNVTPAAEFNAFADPHALAVVLESHMRVELVSRDAFQDLRLGPLMARRLELECGAAGRLLAGILDGYMQAVSRAAGGVAVPDAAAAIYALRPDLGMAMPATVRVVTEGELTRGQTIVATTPEHQASLALGFSGVEQLAAYVGAPGFDYETALREAAARAPHNATVVFAIDAPAMAELLEEGLMDLGLARAVGG